MCTVVISEKQNSQIQKMLLKQYFSYPWQKAQMELWEGGTRVLVPGASVQVLFCGAPSEQ